MTNTDKQEQIYRWVKASERLPETKGWFICKAHTFGDAVISQTVLFNPEFDSPKNRFEMCTGWSVNNFEWLEPYSPLEDAGQRGEVEEFLEDLTFDPYPEDVFLPIPTNVLEMIHSTLMEEYKMPLDRLTGHIGRRLRRPIIAKANSLLETLKAQSSTPQGKDGYTKQDVINAWNSAYGGDSFASGEDYEASLKQ